ncbi:hypothetical protein RF11_16070 [Thelohanellus kitauei]|uniref:Uncharacterized protein n=1 Tax=Thelohanellus kitauei TaxID=669202 RepID=A0A0C2MEX2_THEKT|nr:hypothetical protein RF11_16070 [Thelohanellus kitauei]
MDHKIKVSDYHELQRCEMCGVAQTTHSNLIIRERMTVDGYKKLFHRVTPMREQNLVIRFKMKKVRLKTKHDIKVKLQFDHMFLCIRVPTTRNQMKMIRKETCHKTHKYCIYRFHYEWEDGK